MPISKMAENSYALISTTSDHKTCVNIYWAYKGCNHYKACQLLCNYKEYIWFGKNIYSIITHVDKNIEIVLFSYSKIISHIVLTAILPLWIGVIGWQLTIIWVLGQWISGFIWEWFQIKFQFQFYWLIRPAKGLSPYGTRIRKLELGTGMCLWVLGKNKWKILVKYSKNANVKHPIVTFRRCCRFYSQCCYYFCLI
jgi:hypothetical protein